MKWHNIVAPAIALLSSTAFGLTTHVHDSSFTPDATLHITRQDISIGGIRRSSVLVNGTNPGPPIHLPEDKVVWIRVYNDVPNENVTMHWHGLTQAAYPFSDGSPLASQWPIPPNRYFDYELKSPNGSAGTYFYHSHVGFQASSANGPLIVDDTHRPAPYPTSGDRIIHLSELFNSSDAEIESKLTGKPFMWPGDAMAWLINGKTIPEAGVTDPSSAKLHVINVDPNTFYRFRYIGASSLAYASIGFEKHNNSNQFIIEADGHYTRTYGINVLQVGSGQRFSTLFRSKTCTELKLDGKLDYYMQIESRDRPVLRRNYAILRYRNNCGMKETRVPETSNPASPPLTLPPTINGYLDYKLQPLYSNNFPTASEVTRRIVINAQLVGNGYFIWKSSNSSWSEHETPGIPHTTPREPYLVSLYKNQSQYLPDYDAAVQNGGLDPGTKTYPAKLGEVIEVVIQQVGSNPGGMLDTHPWHAHGKHFYDIGGGPGEYSPEVAEKQLEGTKPVQRDTVMLFRYTPTTAPNQVQGWRAWRLRVEAAGVWMVHCHTLHHMVQGMQTVWVFGDADDIMRVGQPDVDGYLEYGGNVTGNGTQPARVLHFNELDDN